MTNHISIIIPVFNGLNYTKKCLKDLNEGINLSPEPSRFSIIIVDDGSTDGTAQWVQDNYPGTIVLQGDGNLWWSGGINKGTRYALDVLNTDYILWWNNDIVTSGEYFKNLYRLLQQDKIMIGGSKIYYANSNRVWSMGGIFDTRSGEKYMTGMNEPDNDKYSVIHEADWLPGMGTFIHRSVFEKTGMVDEVNFPQYHGDSDFTFRAKLAGYNILVYPELKIWNDKTNSAILHNNNYSQLIRTLNDIKSNYHIAKDILFYRRYSTSALAYKTLAFKYCYYVGGFIKWKLLNMLGFTKKETV